MRNDPGFTLIEALLAIVLLAVVVGASVQYLQGRPGLDRVAADSQHAARVAVELADFELGHREPMRYEAYQEFAALHGWSCQRVDADSSPGLDDQLPGEWVLITDGEHRSIHWASVEPEPGGTP